MADPSARVSIAFAGNVLDWSPTWTALDQLYPNLITSYTIDRGRQYELDRTDVGRAQVRIADPDGVLDPTNTSGPYWGSGLQIVPLKQVMIRRYNPVAATWETRFRGWIQTLDYSYDPSRKVAFLTLSLVDVFEILSTIQMTPYPAFGDDPSVVAPDSAGNVVFQNNMVKDRVDNVLANAIGTAANYWAVVFDPQVEVATTVYSPGETPLTAIQEAADAEFPGVSNAYGDRFGRLAFHGRLAKFDPVGTHASSLYTAWSSSTAYVAGDRVLQSGISYECVLAHTNHAPPNTTYWMVIPAKWQWTHWAAGDGTAVNASPTTLAYIRQFGYQLDVSKVINQAVAYPQYKLVGTDQVIFNPAPATASPPGDDLASLVENDTTSQTRYGIRSWQAPNLITLRGHMSPGYTSIEETNKFSQFYVANYADPQKRITTIGFRSVQPAATGAGYTWQLLSQLDVSDRIDITIKAPGSSSSTGQFTAEPYFVEGVHEQVNPLNATYDDVTMTLDLSPFAYFSDTSMFPGG